MAYLKKESDNQEVNIQQNHYAAFDWTVPLEKVGLMKSVTHMKSFSVVGNRVNDAHKGFLLIVDQNVPTEEAIPAEEDTPENVGECIRLSDEFHLLPPNHLAKEDKLEGLSCYFEFTFISGYILILVT
ncbi:hypothetical protein ACFE04_019353 [Oxalis oulophora]